MAAAVELVNKRYKEAFDLIKYVFKVDQLYEDQIGSIKVFLDDKNIFFSSPTSYGKSIVYQSLMYNAMLLRGADHYMKTYIKETACRRQNLMRNFENYTEQEVNGCQCCDNCAKSCSCSLSCNKWVLMNTASIKQPTATQILRTRNVCSEQKKQLYELLHEYRKELTQEKMVSLLGVQREFYTLTVSLSEYFFNFVKFFFGLDV